MLPHITTRPLLEFQTFRHHVVLSHIYKEEKKSRENEVVHALSKEQKGRLPAYLVLLGRP